MSPIRAPARHGRPIRSRSRARQLPGPAAPNESDLGEAGSMGPLLAFGGSVIGAIFAWVWWVNRVAK